MKQKEKNNKIQYDSLVERGLKYVGESKYLKSIEIFEKAISLDSTKWQAYINLSNIFLIENALSRSTETLFTYLDKNGFEKNIVNHLGKICLQNNLDDDFNKLFNFFNINKLKNNKDFQYLYFLKGQFEEKNLNFTSSIAAYKKSIVCDKFFFDSYINLFNILESSNKIKDFQVYLETSFKIFIEKKYKNILLLYRSILLFRNKKYDQSINIIKNNDLYLAFINQKHFLIKLLDLESKNYEKIEKYDYAFEKIRERNQKLTELKINKKYDRKIISENFIKYKAFYNKNNVSYINNRLNYYNDSNLVFLLGFPRSGTTLLDTILRTHSKIKVLEEKPFLLDLRHKYFTERNNKLFALRNIEQNEKDLIRNSYFKNLKLKEEDKNKIIIDKLPLSIIEIGFIKCIFPNSKIILALRHPCDVVISCYFSSFKINDAMINFLDWENTINFYNEVFDLFEHYENQLSLNYYKIKYENVVKDFKNQIVSLLKFLNLEYENELKNFHLTAKKREKISTPSYTQVINPLYKSSIERWKNFKNIADPSENLKKWIEKFNY